MKRILLIVGAALSGFYAIGSLVIFVHTLATAPADTTWGITEIAASVVPPCIGGIICASCCSSLRGKAPAN